MMAEDDKELNPESVDDVLDRDWKEEDAEEDKLTGDDEESY